MWVESSDPSSSCTVSTQPPQQQTLTCNFQNVPASQSRTVSVTTQTDQADCATLSNTATVTSTGDTTPNDNTNTGSITVRCPDVSVLKTGNGTVTVPGAAQFTMVITNNGPGAATGVGLTDTLPGTGWTISSQTAGNCVINGGNSIVCTGISLPTQAATYTVVVSRATAAPADCGPLQNTAAITATGDTNLGNNSSSATVTVNCPDIVVVKNGNGPVTVGQSATFEIMIGNFGPGTATGVTLSDTLLGSGWSILFQTGNACSIDEGVLSCSGITLLENGKYIIEITKTTTIADCADIPNTATVSATNESPQGTAPNSASATVVVLCADVSVQKTPDAGVVQAGELATFTITVTNSGDGSSSVSFDDQLPDGGLDWSTTTPDCVVTGSVGDQDLECSFTLAGGGAQKTITVSSPTTAAGACGVKPNTVTITASGDITPANNADQGQVTVECGGIIVRKETSPNGDSRVFQFEASYDQDGFQLSDGQSNNSGPLAPGGYSVGEMVPVGWDLTGIDCGEGTESEGSTAFVFLSGSETITCVFTNTKRPGGVINVIKTANPTSVKEPGGLVDFTVTVENTGPVNVTINSVVDDKFGNLANVAGGSPSGCFAVPFVLTPGQSSTCTFPKTVTGTAGTSHVNVVTASGVDTSQNPVSDSDDATVTFTERLIDLVIVKDATSPTPLNEIVTYTMTVTNKGPDTATNVQLADPAPAGIRYVSVVPGSPTCTVTPALLTCSLGTLEVGQSRTVTLTARANVVGRHTNTATVTGSGGRETNPADNVDTAVTVVPQSVQPPPTPKPKPKPQQQVCLTLTVTPKMVTADGRPDTLKVRVTAGTKRVKGTKVRVFGAGVKKTSRSKANGMATVVINPRRPGVITITAVETKNQQVCGPRRIGAVGVFLPPLTG